MKTNSRWWPFFVVIFYLLAPIPTLISRRYTDDTGSSSALKEACAFFTTGIVLSAFALPIVLARSPAGDPTVSSLALLKISRKFFESKTVKFQTKVNSAKGCSNFHVPGKKSKTGYKK